MGKEEEFREHMQEQNQKYDDFKQRWEMQELSRYEWKDENGVPNIWCKHDDSVSVAIAEATKSRKACVRVPINDEVYDIILQGSPDTGANLELRVAIGGSDDAPVFDFKSKWGSDRLRNAQAPDELLTYYQAESKMLRHFHALKNEDDNADHGKAGGGRALGMCIWFKRWLRVHRGLRQMSLKPNTRSQSREPDPSRRRNSLAGQRV